MKNHKNKIIAGLIILIILGVAFFYGAGFPGTYPSNEVSDKTENSVITSDFISLTEEQYAVTDKDKKEEIVAKSSNETPPVKEPETPSEAEETDKNTKTEEIQSVTVTKENEIKADANKETEIKNSITSENKDRYNTESASATNPLPVEPQDIVISDKELTCTLSVRCDTILKNMNLLDEEKFDIVPKDGIIYKEKNVPFYEGESVFNVLTREMKRSKLHIEFVNTPVYNSAYIEGIGNLYEFDCGELSGWMYRVNGWFPNYGCSRYQLKAGDKIEWVYTCDLGADVGGDYLKNRDN